MRKKIFTGFAVLSAVLFTSISSAQDTFDVKRGFIKDIESATSIYERESELRRNNLLSIIQKMNEDYSLGKPETFFLGNLSNRYNKKYGDMKGLLLSVDKIPSSIIIAVAIKESQWGTNSKMMQANNPFGLRCFYKGCGTPDEQSEQHFVYSELVKFPSILDAVRGLAYNININSEFDEFRVARKKMRDNGEYLTSLPLAELMKPLSPNYDSYGSALRVIIHENKLYYLDK